MGCALISVDYVPWWTVFAVAWLPWLLATLLPTLSTDRSIYVKNTLKIILLPIINNHPDAWLPRLLAKLLPTFATDRYTYFLHVGG